MNRDPLEPKSMGREIAECLGFLLMSMGALAAWTGHLSIDKLAGYAETAKTTAGDVTSTAAGYAIPALAALAALVLMAGMLVRGVRRAASWRYRSRWAEVMRLSGLVVEDKDGVQVPQLRAIEAGPHTDLVTVRMLPGQSSAEWQAKVSRTADLLGARDAWVRTDADRPGSNVISVEFAHPGAPRRELLAPAPLSLPTGLGGRTREPVKARVQKAGIRIDWARVQLRDEDGAKVAGGVWGLRVRWGAQWTTVAISG